MVSAQFNGKIKVFRSDNAKELALIDFFNNEGVIHQFSCVERPQQNSVVERKHQHLLNVARALFFQSKVPTSFWSECVSCATFLINRTPSKLLKFLTPYEKLHKCPPDFSRFRSFGCLDFASTLPSSRNNYTQRERCCVFIGYPMGTKAYKLMDIKQKNFFSRDVTFQEDIFPFTHSSTCSS